MDEEILSAVSTSDSTTLVEGRRQQDELSCKQPSSPSQEQLRNKFRITVEPVMFLAVTGFMMPG